MIELDAGIRAGHGPVMRLSESLEEATRSRYFYVRTRAGKTAGGPYTSIAKLSAGIQRAIDRGLDRNSLLAQEMVGGAFRDLSPDETEAVIAGLE